MRVGIGGKAAVAAAAALLAVTMVGPPLYSSSATSAALQTSVAAACPSDVGILLDVPLSAVEGLDQRAAVIGHVDAPVHTEIASIRLVQEDSSVPAQLVWRDGLDTPAAGSIAVPAEGEVAVPGSYAATAGLRAGDRIETDGTGDVDGFRIAGIFPDIPVQPEPAYWCGLRQLVRPSAAGAAPAPVLLADQATVRAASADGRPAALWELHPDTRDLTWSSARDLVEDLRAFVASSGALTESGASATPLAGQTAPGLGRYVDEAEQVGDAVARGVIGLRIVAAAAALILLALAAGFVVRSRRDELRHRVVLGEGRGTLGLLVAEGQAIPALAGTAVGALATVVAVRACGPSPDIDGDVYRRVAVLGAAGLVVALVAVGAVAGALADRLVDRPARAARWWRAPWEVIPVAAALVAWSRLDRLAGVRVVGTGVGGNDGLAAAFPALAVIAVGTVMIRPLRWLWHRGRHGANWMGATGRHAIRRLGADPIRYAVLAGVVTAGVGAAVVAPSVSATTDRLVEDKATTFLGADLRVVTAAEPVIPPRLTATPISRVTADDDGTDVQVIGIDPDTFADVVRWRDDAAEYSLDDLLDVLAVDDMLGAPLPALVVGASSDARTLQTDGGDDIDISPVAVAAFFPGKTPGPLVIVNRDALAADQIPTAPEIWVREPPPDTPRLLAAAGNLVRGSQGPTDVLSTTSVQGTRWVGQALWGFAVYSGLVLLTGAVIVVTRDLRERRAARSFGRRLGGRPPGEFGPALGALLAPVVAGGVLGMVTGLVVVRIAAGRVDTAANLPPGVRLVYDVGPALVAVAVACAVAALAAVVAQITVARDEEVRSSA